MRSGEFNPFCNSGCCCFLIISLISFCAMLLMPPVFINGEAYNTCKYSSTYQCSSQSLLSNTLDCASFTSCESCVLSPCGINTLKEPYCNMACVWMTNSSLCVTSNVTQTFPLPFSQENYYNDYYNDYDGYGYENEINNTSNNYNEEENSIICPSSETNTTLIFTFIFPIIFFILIFFVLLFAILIRGILWKFHFFGILGSEFGNVFDYLPSARNLQERVRAGKSTNNCTKCSHGRHHSYRCTLPVQNFKRKCNCGHSVHHGAHCMEKEEYKVTRMEWDPNHAYYGPVEYQEWENIPVTYYEITAYGSKYAKTRYERKLVTKTKQALKYGANVQKTEIKYRDCNCNGFCQCSQCLPFVECGCIHCDCEGCILRDLQYEIDQTITRKRKRIFHCCFIALQLLILCSSLYWYLYGIFLIVFGGEYYWTRILFSPIGLSNSAFILYNYYSYLGILICGISIVISLVSLIALAFTVAKYRDAYSTDDVAWFFYSSCCCFCGFLFPPFWVLSFLIGVIKRNDTYNKIIAMISLLLIAMVVIGFFYFGLLF